MKIIESPKIWANTAYRIRCKSPKCAALIEVTDSELKSHFDQREGTARIMVCPCCKTETWIDESKISNYLYKP